MQTKELVQEITDYVNTFGDKSKEFNKSMSCEHRTLQQSFTKLCLSWIEHVAKDEYLTDGRNEQSKKIAQQLLEGFKDKQIKEGFTGHTLELMSKPSGYLGCI
jgi:uncharacterized membrane-anchored protein YjiN (DUF445 family)